MRKNHINKKTATYIIIVFCIFLLFSIMISRAYFCAIEVPVCNYEDYLARHTKLKLPFKLENKMFLDRSSTYFILKLSPEQLNSVVNSDWKRLRKNELAGYDDQFLVLGKKHIVFMKEYDDVQLPYLVCLYADFTNNVLVIFWRDDSSNSLVLRAGNIRKLLI